MAQFRARIETSGTIPGRHTFYPAEETVRLPLSFGVDPSGGAGLVAQMPTLADSDIVAVELQIDDGAGGPIRLTTGGRTLANTTQTPDRWFFDNTATNAYLDNTEGCWRNELTFAPPGVTVPIPAIVISGPALAATPIPDPCDAVITYRARHSTPGEIAARAVFSEMQFVAFVDDNAGEDPNDLSTFLRRIEGSMSASGAVFTTPSGQRLNSCGWAAVDPRYAIWLRPGDLGNGADQIPVSFAANAASLYANHPGVFYTAVPTRNQRAWEVTRVEQAPITDPGGAAPVVTVDSAPIASRWLFVVDGTPIPVVLAHPTGSDFRRPRTIWNNVIVPLIQNSAINRGPIFFRDFIDGGGNRQLIPIGVLQHLRRLEYAGFLEPLGPTDESITTLFFQS